MSNGQSIVIKGDISGSEDLVIAGRVEGSITLNGRVLTLRRSDLDTLALIYDSGVDELVATFLTWGVIGAHPTT